MWRDVEPRPHDPDRPDPSRGRRAGTDPRDPERPDPRDVFTQGVALPRGRRRERIRVGTEELALRGSEVRLLATVGAFRAIPERDLHADSGRARNTDVETLRAAGLIETRPYGSGARRTTLVTLTPRGRDLLEQRQDRDPEVRQRFYAGLARRPELGHDSHFYRAYCAAARELQAQGARIERVVLDYDLKREYQAFLQERNRERKDRSGRPDRTAEEIREWAERHRLPYEDESVQFPDVRIEYEDRDGRREVEDLEIITPHYRGAHAAAKAASGFRTYYAVGVRAGGGRRGKHFDPRAAEEWWE